MHGTEHRWAQLGDLCMNQEGKGAYLKSRQKRRERQKPYVQCEAMHIMYLHVSSGSPRLKAVLTLSTSCISSNCKAISLLPDFNGNTSSSSNKQKWKQIHADVCTTRVVPRNFLKNLPHIRQPLKAFTECRPWVFLLLTSGIEANNWKRLE